MKQRRCKKTLKKYASQVLRNTNNRTHIFGGKTQLDLARLIYTSEQNNLLLEMSILFVLSMKIKCFLYSPIVAKIDLSFKCCLQITVPNGKFGAFRSIKYCLIFLCILLIKYQFENLKKS